MAQIPAATLAHYRQMQRLQVVAVHAARRSWARVDGRNISGTWNTALADLAPLMQGIQVQAATSALTAGTLAMAEQGVWVAPTAFADPGAFAGHTTTGADLTSALYSPAPAVKQAIAAGASTTQALAAGRGYLEQLVRTIVADTGRAAGGVDVAVRPGTGYVRMLNPPSCSRCTVLAGRFYRWNAGFERHPGCDCVHVPSTVTDTAEAYANGLVDDPRAVFDQMSPAEQDKTFTRAGAQAIRDGADMSQVVNARRGMTKNRVFTTEGAGRRGYAGSLLKRGQRRMTPESIYAQAAGDREKALALLREHGYVLPGGVTLKGAHYEGFGQMGRGGTRKVAAQAVLDARATGVRDPASRYTMTAAERHDYDIEQRYRAVLAGRSPFVSPGFGNTPDPTGTLRGYGASSASGSTRLPTPLEAALVETQYRALLVRRTGGL